MATFDLVRNFDQVFKAELDKNIAGRELKDRPQEQAYLVRPVGNTVVRVLKVTRVFRCQITLSKFNH